ncbi:hypothetical protein Fmac_003607 [Flemingia macrophylla]|uniref:U-box domain-containing protein n=1 Tax=Flemingia macrophylla TaxID=520843 RepID=A0ABD1N2L3_9FABA
MVIGWRRWKKKKQQQREAKSKVEEVVTPNEFLCPISLELMKDPVTLCTGITLDRETIERWFDEGNLRCPVTNQIVTNLDLIPNHTLRMMIQDWCVDNRTSGVQRIPTPRVPVTPMEVQRLLLNLHSSASRLDQHACLELLQTLEKWRGESERNTRCMEDNGVPCALASVFHAFAVDTYNATLLHHILLLLNSMFRSEARQHLGSKASLRCMVWLLTQRDLSLKEASVVALKNLLSLGDERHVEALAETEEGIGQVLVEFLNRRMMFGPTIAKASLAVVWYLVSSPSPCGEKMRLKFIELGTVSLMLEIMVDSERSTCEKALGVFESLCGCEEGREEAYGNALAVPVLVKKLFRVSSEHSVSAIWKLCKYGGERVVVEALQVGAFQKLLLMLQVGCAHETKEKATQLLKWLNPYRDGVECIDSDFKNLKRSM